MSTSARFTKLPDETWGIRLLGPEPDLGATVTVSKKNDETAEVTVTEIVAPFDGGFLCRFVNAESPAPAAKPRSFKPTAEQLVALELFKTGESIAVEAGAGTGKTSTCVLLGEDADARNLRGQYIAFNKKIVKESKGKFPRSVACDTAHSLAYRAVGLPFDDRMNSGSRMKSHEIALILGIDPIRVTKYTLETKEFSPAFLGGLVMKAVKKFCQSADPEITYRHVPLVDALDAPATEDAPATYAVNRYVAKALEPALRTAWADLTSLDGRLPFTLSTAMAVFLKVWQLSSPRIHADYILFDEAQDASPVMVAVIAAQTHAQLVWVGDANQQIYSFTGAINALENVPAGSRAMLTQSFRFGPAIAEVANEVLATLPTTMRLSGTPAIASRVVSVANPHAILTRTNATAIRAVMTALANARQPFLVGGGKEIAVFCRAARDLQYGQRTDHPELACFSSWLEVQEYVESDEQGDDLRLMVSLIDEFGVQAILDAVNGCAKEADADVIVSTAHKAKGCEWESVALGSDFPTREKMGDEERRLLYVAVTRARVELDFTAVAYFAEDDPVVMAIAAAEAAPDAPPAPPATLTPPEAVEAVLEAPSASGSYTLWHDGRVESFITDRDKGIAAVHMFCRGTARLVDDRTGEVVAEFTPA